MNYFVQLHEDTPFYGVFPRGRAPVKQVSAPNSSWVFGSAMSRFETPARVFVRLSAAQLADERCELRSLMRLNAIPVEPATRLRFASVTAERGPHEFLSYMDHGGDMPIRVSQTVDAPFPL